MKYIYGQYHQTEDIKNIERKLIIILICVTFSYQITFNDKDRGRYFKEKCIIIYYMISRHDIICK